MGAQHTPGPWETMDDALSSEGGLLIQQIGGGRAILASVGPSPVSGTDAYAVSADDEANARLIAAAPEMLEVLQRIHRYLDDGGEMSCGMPAHRKVVEVIAKATEA